MGHHHHHSHIGKKLWLAIVLNGIVSLLELIVGFASGSLSLLSDAVHNVSDVVALCLSYFAVRMTSRESTVEKTYGYKRGEILSAMFNTAGLLIVAVLLCKEAIERFSHPSQVNGTTIFVLGALSLVVNLGSALLLRKEAAQSVNVRSAYLHLFSDSLSSVAVLVGGVLISWTQVYWIDSVLSIGIACFLVYSSWHILMEVLRIIMHFTPAHIDVHKLEEALLKDQRVSNVHHVHVWQLNDQEVHFEAHVDFKEDLPLSEVSQAIDSLSQMLREKFGIHHTVLQPEIGVQDRKTLIVTECHQH